MKIAIDVDDCISNTAEVDFVTCYEYNKALHPDDNKNYVNEYHNAPTIFGLTKEQDDDFYIHQRKLCIEEDLIKPKVFADKIIAKLIRDGHDVTILTSRGDLYWGNALEETKKWLNKYNIPYTRCVANSGDKGKYCAENNIDIMIDDNLKYIKQCNMVGIRTITFNNNYNPKYYPEELRHYQNDLNTYASSWSEVSDKVDLISKIKEEFESKQLM